MPPSEGEGSSRHNSDCPDFLWECLRSQAVSEVMWYMSSTSQHTNVHTHNRCLQCVILILLKLHTCVYSDILGVNSIFPRMGCGFLSIPCMLVKFINLWCHSVYGYFKCIYTFRSIVTQSVNGTRRQLGVGVEGETPSEKVNYWKDWLQKLMDRCTLLTQSASLWNVDTSNPGTFNIGCKRLLGPIKHFLLYWALFFSSVDIFFNVFFLTPCHCIGVMLAL